MKERTRYLIAVGLFILFVAMCIGLTLAFGPKVWLVIGGIIAIIVLSLLAICWLEKYLVEPIGKWWFHKHNRHWDI